MRFISVAWGVGESSENNESYFAKATKDRSSRKKTKFERRVAWGDGWEACGRGAGYSRLVLCGVG